MARIVTLGFESPDAGRKDAVFLETRLGMSGGNLKLYVQFSREKVDMNK